MSKKWIGHLLALFTITIWGVTFIASKNLLTEFTPFQTMLLRFCVAYVVLLCLNHDRKKFVLKDELWFLSLAIFGSTLYFICENVALTYTLASNVSIIIALAPIFTAVLAHFTTEEHLHKEIFLGFIVAFLGVALVVFNGTVILKLNPIGDLLSLLAAALWAIYSVLLKRQVSRYNSFFLTRRVVFYSIITTLPLVLIEHKEFPIAAVVQPKLLISLLILGVLGSAICYVTWNMAMLHIGTVATNNYIYLNPFVTMVAAGIFLKEPVTAMGLIGAVLIVGGIIISLRKKKVKEKD